MPSPFPGMDPFIEASIYWGDFHTTFLTAIRAQLNERLPSRYRANLDVLVAFQAPEIGVRRRQIEPEVSVSEREDRAKTAGKAGLMTKPSLRVVLPTAERRTKKSVLLVDRRGNRVVTVLELLSPANKVAGEDRQAYILKRNHCFANKISFVELDFLRGGHRLPVGVPVADLGDYCVMVCRAWEYPKADLWSIGLRDRLPQIPVPLDPDVADVPLTLRSCLDRAYDEAIFASELPYDAPLTPRPRPADLAWIKTILARRDK